MSTKSSISPKPASLREQAEGTLRVSPPDITAMSMSDIQKLVHELQVHQIELKIQNEELLAAQAELAHAHDRFNDLYDFAPVGYLTTDSEGTILEANHTAAAMLGIERANLVGRKFTRFVAPAGQDALYLHHQAIFSGSEKHISNVLLRRSDGTTFFGWLESLGVNDPVTQARQCRSAISDITERKRVEDALRAKNEELERFNRVAVGRELRMMELKKEINAFCVEAGQPPRHRVEER